MLTVIGEHWQVETSSHFRLNIDTVLYTQSLVQFYLMNASLYRSENCGHIFLPKFCRLQNTFRLFSVRFCHRNLQPGQRFCFHFKFFVLSFIKSPKLEASNWSRCFLMLQLAINIRILMLFCFFLLRKCLLNEI